jgi:hypothetical protein
MISLRLIGPAVVVAAVVAGCITYFVSSATPEPADQQLPPTVANGAARPGSEIFKNIHPTEDDISSFERAAEGILKRARNAQASVGEAPVTRPIPLPKRRPILRP